MSRVGVILAVLIGLALPAIAKPIPIQGTLDSQAAVGSVELIRVGLTGYRLHIDGVFVMLAPDLALCNSALLPWEFIQRLGELGIKLIEVCPEDDSSIINSLAIGPGRVIMPDGLSTRTERELTRAGVEILQLPYDKVILGGGGLHCSTSPLIRDEV